MPDQTQPSTPADPPVTDRPPLPHGEANLTPLAQLRRMQHILYADCVDPTTDRRLRPQAACAWDRLELRKAAMTMRPTPKPIDVSALHKRSSTRTTRRPHDRAGAPTAEPVKPVAPQPAVVSDDTPKPLTT